MDKISAQNKMKVQGYIKRVYDMIYENRFRDQINSNIFAPTSAIYMFQHLNKYINNHSIILADFDCFLEPKTKKSIMGINAPLIENKLKGPTEAQKFSNYLIPRGAADILFPTDFHFL